MKAQIVSSHHSVMIEGFQIDMIYDFSNNILECYVDGSLYKRVNFRPNYVALSYLNVLEVSVYYFELWKKDCISRDRAERRELGIK